MAYYLVRYSLGTHNEYVYPKSMAGVVWKSTLYHYNDHVMAGETDAAIQADGKDVIALAPAEFNKQTRKLQASFPKLKDPPDLLFPFNK